MLRRAVRVNGITALSHGMGLLKQKTRSIVGLDIEPGFVAAAEFSNGGSPRLVKAARPAPAAVAEVDAVAEPETQVTSAEAIAPAAQIEEAAEDAQPAPGLLARLSRHRRPAKQNARPAPSARYSIIDVRLQSIASGVVTKTATATRAVARSLTYRTRNHSARAVPAGMSSGEIALVLGRSPAAVQKELVRVMHLLKEHIHGAAI